MQKHNTKQMQALMPEDAINEAIRQLHKARQVIYISQWEGIQEELIRKQAESILKESAQGNPSCQIVLGLIELKAKVQEMIPALAYRLNNNGMSRCLEDIEDIHDLSLYLKNLMTDHQDGSSNTSPEPTNAA